MTTYAAIGTDGQRLVVWGIGETPDAASEDALSYEGGDGIELSIVECSAGAAELIEAGTIALEGVTPLAYRPPTRSDLARVTLRSEA